MDIDRDYDTTRVRMTAVCDDGLVVTTGLTPERRSQHWVRLDEPCDDLKEFVARRYENPTSSIQCRCYA